MLLLSFYLDLMKLMNTASFALFHLFGLGQERVETFTAPSGIVFFDLSILVVHWPPRVISDD